MAEFDEVVPQDATAADYNILVCLRYYNMTPAQRKVVHNSMVAARDNLVARLDLILQDTSIATVHATVRTPMGGLVPMDGEEG